MYQWCYLQRVNRNAQATVYPRSVSLLYYIAYDGVLFRLYGTIKSPWLSELLKSLFVRGGELPGNENNF